MRASAALKRLGESNAVGRSERQLFTFIKPSAENVGLDRKTQVTISCTDHLLPRRISIYLFVWLLPVCLPVRLSVSRLNSMSVTSYMDTSLSNLAELGFLKVCKNTVFSLLAVASSPSAPSSASQPPAGVCAVCVCVCVCAHVCVCVGVCVCVCALQDQLKLLS